MSQPLNEALIAKAHAPYILVSAKIVPRVRAADILDLLPWSDHAPVRVEL